MKTILSRSGGALRGSLRVPGDKSISHRSVMLASIARGSSRIEGYLPGTDVLATIAAFRNLGVVVDQSQPGVLTVHGVGLDGLAPPHTDLDLGNSGTAVRLLAGVLAGAGVSARLIGDESLSRRPMERIITPLQQMGAVIHSASGGRLPMRMEAGHRLRGIRYEMPVASAQVKSCILLAGLFAEGKTAVHEAWPSRDHTERMLRSFGYRVESESGWVQVQGGGVLQGTALRVPADISSAAFFLVAACIAPDSDLTLCQVGMNPTRTGIIEILRQMGADIELQNQTALGGEPVADIRVRTSRLQGIRIDEKWVPLAIDEFPVIAVAAALARGTTTVSGARELRYKESDRIADTARGLNRLGIDVETRDDGMVIQGGVIRGGVVDSCADHRLAMSFAVAGLVARDTVTILNCDNVATSYPGFVADMRRVGADVTGQE